MLLFYYIFFLEVNKRTHNLKKSILLTSIYKMNNTVCNLRRIIVEQTLYEIINIDENLVKNLIYQNTTYDKYIKSKESTAVIQELKNLLNKIIIIKIL